MDDERDADVSGEMQGELSYRERSLLQEIRLKEPSRAVPGTTQEERKAWQHDRS